VAVDALLHSSESVLLDEVVSSERGEIVVGVDVVEGEDQEDERLAAGVTSIAWDVMGCLASDNVGSPSTPSSYPHRIERLLCTAPNPVLPSVPPRPK